MSAPAVAVPVRTVSPPLTWKVADDRVTTTANQNRRLQIFRFRLFICNSSFCYFAVCSYGFSSLLGFRKQVNQFDMGLNLLLIQCQVRHNSVLAHLGQPLILKLFSE